MSAAAGFAVLLDPAEPPLRLCGAVAAIGNFDGVHRGHKAVIQRAQALARRRERPCAVVSFEPHPADVFAGRSVIFRLTPQEAKAVQLARLGVDALFLLSFTKTLAALPPLDFIQNVLVGQLRLSAIVVGYDFRFGAKRAGDAALLQEVGPGLGLLVEIVERIAQDEAGSLDAVSSTATREALEKGDVALANRLLGHPFFIDGVVRSGMRLGRQLGFPTANIALDPSCRLRHGVYAVTLTAEGVTRRGVASFGSRPTVDDGAPLLEVFVFDFEGDLYGKSVEVTFYAFLRAERKFDGLDPLVEQMKRDEAQARAILTQL